MKLQYADVWLILCMSNEEPFELPVIFKGGELMLPAKLVQMGYTYKIFVTVNEQEIIFEPDEEKEFTCHY